MAAVVVVVHAWIGRWIGGRIFMYVCTMYIYAFMQYNVYVCKGGYIDRYPCCLYIFACMHLYMCGLR